MPDGNDNNGQVPTSGLGQLLTDAIANALAQSIGAITGAIPSTLGTAPLIGQTEQATFGGTITQAQWDAFLSVLGDIEHSPGPLEQLKAVDFSKSVDLAQKIAEPITKDLWAQLMDQIKKFVGLTHVEPERALDNVARAYAFASSLGFVAHAISAASQIQVFSSHGPNLSGLAAFVGHMAGFSAIASSVTYPLYTTAIRIPWLYHLQRQFTPRRPDLQDLLRLRGKRLLPGCIPPEQAPGRRYTTGKGGFLPGFDEFAREMEYQGYSRKWAEIYEQDLYREPRYFEMTVMANSPEIPLKWWYTKARRLQYDETDASFLVQGIRYRVRSRWIERLIDEAVQLHRMGAMSEDELNKLLQEIRLPNHVRAAIIWYAQYRARREDLKQEIDEAKLKYSRDQVDKKGLIALLEAAGLDSEHATRIADIEELKRYHKVWLLTDEERWRKRLSTFKQLFRARRITKPDLIRAFVMAGIPPRWARIMADAEETKRRPLKMPKARKLPISTLRDLVIHGLMTLDEYKERLIRYGFSEEDADIETSLMAAKIIARKEGRVSRKILPHFVRAYIAGLVEADELEMVCQEAGLTPAEIEAARLDYDWRRWQRLEKYSTEEEDAIQDIRDAHDILATLSSLPA